MTAEHGTVSRYSNNKCRCQPCTQANTDYQREWQRKRARLARLGKEVERLVKESR